mgnify:CR=1 FL=1
MAEQRTPETTSATVRPAGHADVRAMIDLQVAVAGEGAWIGRELPLDLDERAAAFTAAIDDPDRLSLVAELHGTIVGQLGLDNDGMGHAGLGMFVAADARGRGVGSVLLADALTWARAHPAIHKVTLQHWPHNAAAHALYRRHGFQTEGYLHRHWRRRNGELWDAVVMGLLVGT